jgi:hypothetical protein
LTGFEQAYQNETFPMYGIDEPTMCCLMGELNRIAGRREPAMRWLSRGMVSPNASERVKNRARDIKDLIAGNVS